MGKVLRGNALPGLHCELPQTFQECVPYLLLTHQFPQDETRETPKSDKPKKKTLVLREPSNRVVDKASVTSVSAHTHTFEHVVHGCICLIVTNNKWTSRNIELHFQARTLRMSCKREGLLAGLVTCLIATAPRETNMLV